MKAILLISGGLGLQCFKTFPENWEVQMIFTDKGSTAIIDYAREKNVPVFIGNPRNGKASEWIVRYHPDIIFSINYLFLIEDDLINWPIKYCFNIHGSLLPKYRGRTPHVWAIINNERITGATVHLVDKGCDTGPVVLQRSFEIDAEETGASVLNKFNSLYPEMIREVLELVKSGRVIVTAQDHSAATIFGVRTPESGKINWGWQKERIYNWVRAQAKPYPMAFTFVNGQKLSINKLEFSNYGFSGNDPDGLVLGLQNDKPVIKTPNGAVSLVEFEGVFPEPGTILL